MVPPRWTPSVGTHNVVGSHDSPDARALAGGAIRSVRCEMPRRGGNPGCRSIARFDAREVGDPAPVNPYGALK